MEHNQQSTRQRVRQHRERLRTAGLRPIQLWVPDTRAPGFAEECQRQSRLLRNDPAEQESLDFIETLAAETLSEWKE